jgi:DedD protein
VEAKLKQRVIGAVVLTTLAIIVLPMLLDGSAEDRARVSATIPEPPQIELKSLTVRQVKKNMEKMEQASAERLPVEAVEEDLPGAGEDKPYQLDGNKVPVSWTLQLGSFGEKDNATRLRQSLRDAQFKSYILTADSSKGMVYRVFVGPMLSKSRLSGYAQDIEGDFELKGQIIRYRIEDDRNQLGG